jgi:hypothetical protein
MRASARIAAGDPVNRREAAVQRHGETGERYVDDGCTELREKRAEHRDGRDLPDQWVEPAGLLEALGKRGQDLIGGANAGETREDIFHGEAVMLGVLAGAGIFNEHKGKAEAGTLAGGGFDAGVGGDAG